MKKLMEKIFFDTLADFIEDEEFDLWFTERLWNETNYTDEKYKILEKTLPLQKEIFLKMINRKDL